MLRILLFLGTFSATSASAQYSLGAHASADNTASSGGLEARLRAGPVQLGVRGEMGVARRAYLAGYRVDDATLGRAELEARFDVGSVGPARFGLHLEVGARRLAGAVGNTAPHTASWAIEAALGLVATIPLRERGVFSAGVLAPFSLEVAPEVVNDAQGALLVFGGGVALHERLWLRATVETGGLYGADGDSAKYLFRGTLGLRALFGATTRDWIAF